MPTGKTRWSAVLLGASALAMPQLAGAKTSHEAELEARLQKLEAEVAELRGDLTAARGEQRVAVAEARAAAHSAEASAAAATTKAEQTATKLAADEAKPQPEGIRNGNTTIKLGGYLKMIAASSHFANGSVATNSLGRDFYLPQAVPVGGR